MSGNINTGSLYVVATPIGNLGDLSRRAEDVLKSVAIVAAEDTRRTRVLLDHIQHRAPTLISLHEHNEASVAGDLLRRLQAGEDVALVSDAGTPLINDPGFTLVRMAYESQIPTLAVPGSCSIIAALSVCPIPCHPFRFIGFLPPKNKARNVAVQAILAESDATVFLEAPHRILQTLAAFGASERRLMLGRELTKKFETVLVGTAQALIEALGEPKGEFVVVVESQEGIQTALEERHVMSALLEDLAPSQAARIAARIFNTQRGRMYELALAMTSTSED